VRERREGEERGADQERGKGRGERRRGEGEREGEEQGERITHSQQPPSGWRGRGGESERREWEEKEE